MSSGIQGPGVKTKWMKMLRIGFASNEKDAQPFKDTALCTLQATRMLFVWGKKVVRKASLLTKRTRSRLKMPHCHAWLRKARNISLPELPHKLYYYYYCCC